MGIPNAIPVMGYAIACMDMMVILLIWVWRISRFTQEMNQFCQLLDFLFSGSLLALQLLDAFPCYCEFCYFRIIHKCSVSHVTVDKCHLWQCISRNFFIFHGFFSIRGSRMFIDIGAVAMSVLASARCNTKGRPGDRWLWFLSSVLKRERITFTGNAVKEGGEGVHNE